MGFQTPFLVNKPWVHLKNWNEIMGLCDVRTQVSTSHHIQKYIYWRSWNDWCKHTSNDTVPWIKEIGKLFKRLLSSPITRLCRMTREWVPSKLIWHVRKKISYRYFAPKCVFYGINWVIQRTKEGTDTEWKNILI